MRTHLCINDNKYSLLKDFVVNKNGTVAPTYFCFLSTGMCLCNFMNFSAGFLLKYCIYCMSMPSLLRELVKYATSLIL